MLFIFRSRKVTPVGNLSLNAADRQSGGGGGGGGVGWEGGQDGEWPTVGVVRPEARVREGGGERRRGVRENWGECMTKP